MESGVRYRGNKIETPETITEYYESKHKTVSGHIPNYFAYGLLLVFAIIIKFFSHLPNILPTQVTLADEHSQPERFIGQRAEFFLRRLTDIGTKVVGSYENEVLAVDLLQREISFVIQQAEPVHRIKIDVQKATGSYYLHLKPHEFRNYYSNIQNLVVQFTSPNSSADSVLLNCHYDTVPESPGASDNGLNCAVLLEILIKLSKQKSPLHNTVIFLFNGAEESPLQASHGFITQHEWSRDVKAVINLDSAGAGGREILFQTTATVPWLAKAYAEAAWYPSGSVAGEEVFQSGVIPSDTDFRIFRDFGRVPGLDIAHVYNGYVYHTKYDTMNFIPPGTIQHTGDNILALTMKLASSPELGTLGSTASPWQIVYFDVFGLFMVVYNELTAIILNVGSAFLSLYTIYVTARIISGNSRSWKNIGTSMALQALNWCLAVVFVIIVAKVLDTFGATLSWYSRQGNILILYILPVILASCELPLLITYYKKRIPPQEMAIRCMNGSQLLWTILLLIGSCLRIRTSFYILSIVLTSATASAIATHRKEFSPNRFIILNFAFTIVPVIYIVNQGVILYTVLIPMAGRMGPQSQPELIMAALAAVFGIITTSFLVPLIVTLKKPTVVVIGICIIHVLGVLAVIFTPYGFPYNWNTSFPATQRIHIMHTERTFHDARGNVRKSDAGFFVQPLDRNNINHVAKVVEELQNARSAAPDCLEELGCGAPIFTSRFLKPAGYGHWVDAYAPLTRQQTTLVLMSQTPVGIHSRKMSFGVRGPDHMAILISPRTGVSLNKWSLDDDTPKIIEKWDERDVYMVHYTHGLVGETLEFDLYLEVNKNNSIPNAILDIAVIGHEIHPVSSRTKDFTDFLSKFPKWVHLTPWISTYKSWTF